MESSLVSGVGAIATSSSADSGPGSASTRAVTSASRPSGSMTTSPGSTFGRGARACRGRRRPCCGGGRSTLRSVSTDFLCSETPRRQNPR